MVVIKGALDKTDTLIKVIGQKDSLNDSNSKPVVTVVDSSSKANVSNYNSKTDQIVEMRTGTLEMTAFEVHNFYRNRG